jgi:hypothetical protein
MVNRQQPGSRPLRGDQRSASSGDGVLARLAATIAGADLFAHASRFPDGLAFAAVASPASFSRIANAEPQIRPRSAMAALALQILSFGGASLPSEVRRSPSGGNPLASAPDAPASGRVGLLNDDALGAIWRAAELESPFNAIIRVLILTGGHWREVAGMSWGELAPDLATWTIPASRAHGGVERVIPLSWRAISVLSTVPRREGVDYLFADRRGRFKGFSKGKASLDAQSGVSGWTMEDLQSATADRLRGVGRRCDSEGRVALRQWGDRVASLGESELTESLAGSFSIRALTRKLRLATSPATVAVH